MRSTFKTAALLAGISFVTGMLAVRYPARAAGLGRFVEMVRLLAPLGRAATGLQVELAQDGVAGTVTLKFKGMPRRGLQALVRQVEVAGGRTRVSRTGSAVRLEIDFDFPNIQARWRIDPRRRVLRLDIGSGRYLLPETPPLPLAGLLPRRFPGREKLRAAWDQVSAGNYPGAERALSALAGERGISGQLACLLLADLSAYQDRLLEAGRRASRCLERAMLVGSSLRPLAAQRVTAYGGSLMSGRAPAATRQAARQPVERSWIYQWLLYERARVLVARGDLAAAAARLQALLAPGGGGVLEERARDLLERLLVVRARRAAPERAEVDLAADIVDALAVLGADWAGCAQVAEAAARQLLLAALPGQAANVILWYLKNTSSDGDGDPELLELLVEAFLELGDGYRAGRTLAYLVNLNPQRARSDRMQLLRARVHHLQKQPQPARQALAAIGERQLLLQVAELVVELSNPEDSRPLLELELLLHEHGAHLNPERRAELLLLLADAAWQEDRRESARNLYQSFVTEFAADERCNMAAYRLRRLGGRAPACRQPREPWDRAARLLGPLAVKEKAHESSR